MAERRYTERSRPPAVIAKPPKTELQREVEKIIAPPVPEPDLKPAEPAPHVATKRKKRTAEVVGRVKGGKVPLQVWFDPELAREVKIAAIEEGLSMQAWVEEAVRQELKARRA